jgi:hypothetical protein
MKKYEGSDRSLFYRRVTEEQYDEPKERLQASEQGLLTIE